MTERFTGCGQDCETCKRELAERRRLDALKLLRREEIGQLGMIALLYSWRGSGWEMLGLCLA